MFSIKWGVINISTHHATVDIGFFVWPRTQGNRIPDPLRSRVTSGWGGVHTSVTTVSVSSVLSGRIFKNFKADDIFKQWFRFSMNRSVQWFCGIDDAMLYMKLTRKKSREHLWPLGVQCVCCKRCLSINWVTATRHNYYCHYRAFVQKPMRIATPVSQFTFHASGKQIYGLKFPFSFHVV